VELAPGNVFAVLLRVGDSGVSVRDQYPVLLTLDCRVQYEI
jgi:hypothetical protein